MTARQIVLDLPTTPPKMTRDNFVVAASNEKALSMMIAWAGSAEPLLAICGPEGAGKTHLGRILSETIAADFLRAESADPRLPGAGPIVLDDVDQLRAPAALLTLVFEAINGGRRLVLIGSGEPRDWAAGQRDLETRLNAAMRIDLAEPDEALLRAVMAKLFRDRQLRVGETIAEYAAPRIRKTFAAASAFVAALDTASFERGEPIGLRLARSVIANHSEAPSGA